MMSLTSALLLALGLASSSGMGMLEGEIIADAPAHVIDPPDRTSKIGYRVKNIGTASLVVKKLTVSGNPEFLTYGMLGVYPVPPGGGARFDVDYRPKDAGDDANAIVEVVIAYDPAELYRARVAKDKEYIPKIEALKAELRDLREQNPALHANIPLLEKMIPETEQERDKALAEEVCNECTLGESRYGEGFDEHRARWPEIRYLRPLTDPERRELETLYNDRLKQLRERLAIARANVKFTSVEAWEARIAEVNAEIARLQSLYDADIAYLRSLEGYTENVRPYYLKGRTLPN